LLAVERPMPNTYVRPISTRLSVGMFTPAILANELTLSLLVPGVRADHEHRAAAADHLAFLAHRFYGRSDLHRPRIRIEKGGPPPQESGCEHEKTGLAADEEG
jgi:hypothetical protein